jgi:large subunit ribosomal protein L4
MAAPKAPALDATGKSTKQVTLEAAIFAAEVKPHLVHETVRAEAAAARSGTKATKSRGMVSGGTSKPWRQKGTGRARAGSTRASQWMGGGLAFAHAPHSFDLKVNRKARKAAFRGALSSHAGQGTIGILDGAAFGEVPSTRAAAVFLGEWAKPLPTLVVAEPEEEAVAKSFRNLDGVLVLDPSTVEVGAVVWAKSLVLTEAALARLQETAR